MYTHRSIHNNVITKNKNDHSNDTSNHSDHSNVITSTSTSTTTTTTTTATTTTNDNNNDNNNDNDNILRRGSFPSLHFNSRRPFVSAAGNPRRHARARIMIKQTIIMMIIINTLDNQQ